MGIIACSTWAPRSRARQSFCSAYHLISGQNSGRRLGGPARRRRVADLTPDQI
jgi:hypothetical protein